MKEPKCPKHLHQEIEVWYFLPLLRKVVSKRLHNLGFKQNVIANILSITPSAVSQYLHKKRACKFPEIEKEVEEIVKKIFTVENCKNELDAKKQFYELIFSCNKALITCKIHEKIEDFDQCFYREILLKHLEKK